MGFRDALSAPSRTLALHSQQAAAAHREAIDFATLRAEASQLGPDTHLRLGHDTIVLEDVALSTLRADMFLF